TIVGPDSYSNIIPQAEQYPDSLIVSSPTRRGEEGAATKSTWVGAWIYERRPVHSPRG
ncbi:hypothetical protein B0H12DRAFT_1104029, partial [Mycena haematopus]